MKESRGWFLFMIAGLLLFVLLGAHLIGMHLSSLFGISYEKTLSFSHVAERSANVAFTIFYLILLALALFHGSYGVRAILLELPWSQGRERIITWIVAGIGLLFFGYGVWAALAALGQKGVFV